MTSGLRRLVSALALALLATLALAQVSSELVTPNIRRVGTRLACLCGSCTNSVGDCAMLSCHYSKPAREKIRDMQAKTASDDAIVGDFVRENGKRALVVPPNEGFARLAWWMPPLMTGMGLALIYWFIRRMRKPSTAPPLDPKVLERYRESIEKDIATLE